MRILLTGASSFTGAWFAHALHEAGHDVTVTFTAAPQAYSGLRRQRIDALVGGCVPVWNAPLGSDLFMEVLEDSFDVLCHHGAQVANYTSDDFDYLAAVANNTRNIRLILAKLSRKGLQRVVLTGSVFEANEGAGDRPLRAFSPYGLSKTLTNKVFHFWCEREGLPLGKFVIPNPFGPYEEPRFTHYLMRTWFNGETALVKTPDYVRDNIHVSLLAELYASFVAATGVALGPSGYVESQGAFSQRFAKAMRERLGLPCRLQLQEQTVFPEPKIRINLDIPDPGSLRWDETQSWDATATYYRRVFGK